MRIHTHKLLLAIHDLLMIVFALYLSNIIYSNYSSYFKLGHITSDLMLGYSLIIITLFLAMAETGVYKYQVILNKLRHAIALQKALVLSLVALVFFSFLLKIQEVTSARVLLGLIYVNLSILFGITRVLIIPNVFYRLVNTKIINRNLLIVGSGKLSSEHAGELIENRNSYFNIIGLVDDEEHPLGQAVMGIPVLGSISDLPQLVDRFNVSDILVASDTQSDYRLHEIINRCKESNRTVHIVSELYNIAHQKINIEEIGKVAAFRYVPPQPGTKLVYSFLKRILDVIACLVVIIGLLPIWLIIALSIKLTSQGPVFYKANVVGKDGKEFLMYKFRSMFVNVSTRLHQEKVKKMILENDSTSKLVDDPRITPLGKFMRKSSIDEFPQLINVLIGQMSLVGPRPCLPYEFSVMKEWQKQRCAIKPGMTGIWQIKGRDEVLFNQQIVLDLYYKEHCSVWMDLEILLSTIPVIIFGRGGA